MANKNSVPAKGDLLISEPFLADANFERSVILLCEHNEEGSLGFVLNKPSTLTLSDALDEVSGSEEVLHTGGPVQQNTLHFVHRIPQLMEQADDLGNGIYWGGDYEALLSLINTRQLLAEDIKFFAGYSGWAPQQLTHELVEEAWIVYHGASAQQIFDMPANQLWREVLRSMGGEYKAIANYPIDPRLN